MADIMFIQTVLVQTHCERIFFSGLFVFALILQKYKQQPLLVSSKNNVCVSAFSVRNGTPGPACENAAAICKRFGTTR